MDPAWKRYFDPPTLAELAGVGLRRSQLYDGGTLAGLHRSSRHGHSVEFAEHRPYTPGDDLRSVDWKIYGRTDRYFLRNREDETTLVCHLLLDATASMDFDGVASPDTHPGSSAEKFLYAARVTASIGFVTLETQDQCSLTILGGHGPDVPLGGGQPQLQALAQALAQSQPAGDQPISERVADALPRLQREGIVVLVSDFWDEAERLDSAVRLVRAAGHDVLLVRVLHEEERSFPLGGMTRFEGLEGEPAVELQADAYRELYRQALAESEQQLEQLSRHSGAHYLSMSTAEPLGKTLAAALHRFYG